ncbi:hypothetical protein RND81_01G138000 [Saponaria officinalis]|uniref:Uncharacterized protein n=1 Tax=Saponaria officinalis TaxID=3572 RepID=A0AAW1N9U4_SAPOF
MIKLSCWKWLGYHICRIIGCMNLFDSKVPCSNCISYKVAPYINLFGLRMMFPVLGQMDSTLTITKYNQNILLYTKFAYQASEPNNLFHTLSGSNIFCFNC